MIAVVLLLQAAPAMALENHNPPQVLPPNSHPYGKSYGEWNALWWQWFFSVPALKNPGLATNGMVDCKVGQSGKVWFLTGNFLSSGTFTRNCNIPEGKALFIPLVNSWADNVCNATPLTVDQLRDQAASYVTPVSNLHASVDGKSFTGLSNYRSKSPVFSYTLPPSPDNVIDAAFNVKLPGDCWPSLTVKPAVADGYYIMLAPLCKGVHTINFGGTGPNISLNVTYTIKVVD